VDEISNNDIITIFHFGWQIMISKKYISAASKVAVEPSQDKLQLSARESPQYYALGSKAINLRNSSA
jgi:hypothetical protein